MAGTKSHPQLKFIFGAIRKLGIRDDARKQMVHSITNGRTESCSELSHTEARELCRKLDQMQTSYKDQERKEKMRKKIISCFHEMNYRHPGGKIDMERIEQWMLHYSYAHKSIMQYQYNELPRLVTQVETMRDKHLNSLFNKFENPLKYD